MAVVQATYGGQQRCITSICFPDGAARARRVVTRSRSRATGKFPSWKMERMVQWESPHERNAMRLLDANPDVLAFHEQPCVIAYVMDGEEHSHYPDLLVCYAGREDFWEVKPRVYAERPEVRRRTALMQAALPSFGYGYHLVTAEELALKPRLKTITELLKFGRRPVPLAEFEKIRVLIEQTGGIPWQAALDGHLGANGRRYLCRLVLEGYLHLDINQALTGASVFRLC